MNNELFEIVVGVMAVMVPLATLFSTRAFQISRSQSELIKILESRNDVLFMRLNTIEDEKRMVENQSRDYRNRVMSLEEDLRTMRKQMVEIEAQNRQLRRHIRTTLKVIRESRPDWQLPKDDEK